MAKGLTIVAVPPVGQVTQLGTDLNRGVWVEDASWDHSLPDHGARQCQFTLGRKSEQEWPDLQAFTPLIIYKAGSVAWTGRIQQTPTIRGRENQITIIGEGWPASMKDDAVEKWFVHNDLTAWRDARAFTQAPLGTYTSAYQVDTGGIPTIRVSNGTTVPINAAGGITLDAGPYNTIKYVGLSVIGGGHAGFTLKWLAGDTPAAATEFGTSSGPPIVTAATPANFTLTTPRRYVTLYMDVNALTNVALDTAWVQLLNIVCLTDTAYGSGTTPTLKASQVIPAVLPYAPKISQSTTKITTTTFNISHFVGALTDPGSYLDAANAFHGYQVFLMDDAAGGAPQLVFRPVPTSPTLVANVGAGIEFEDASRNDGSEIYNRCIVEFTDAAGNAAREERTTGGLPNAIADPDIAFDTVSSRQVTDPTFEASTVGALPAGWATTVITSALTQAAGGDGSSRCVRVTTSATTGAGGAAFSEGTVSFPLTGLTLGRRYRVQARVNRLVGWTAGSLWIGTYVASLSLQNQGTNYAVGGFVAGTYRTVTGDFVANATTMNVAIGVGDSTDDSVAVYDFDNFQVLEPRPTIVDRQGFTRTKVLTTGLRLTSAAAQQIGDVYLQAHRFTPLRGTLTIQGAALKAMLGGEPIPAHLVYRRLGDAVLINETDPDLGTIGRIGILSSVAYQEKPDTATCAVDANRDFIDQLIARLGAFLPS